MSKPAVVLLSGGLDSATIAAIARADGFDIHGYRSTTDNGIDSNWRPLVVSRSRSGSRATRQSISTWLRSAVGASTADFAVPMDRTDAVMAEGIPITYVPARNTVFLALALGHAEVLGAADLFIGINAVDYSGYPDCRPEFIAAFERLANLATKAGVEGTLRFTVHTPLIDSTKAEIIRRGTELGVDYSQTHSCYAPSVQGVACGHCDACLLRRKGFAEAGLTDPIAYQ